MKLVKSKLSITQRIEKALKAATNGNGDISLAADKFQTKFLKLHDHEETFQLFMSIMRYHYIGKPLGLTVLDQFYSKGAPMVRQSLLFFHSICSCFIF